MDYGLTIGRKQLINFYVFDNHPVRFSAAVARWAATWRLPMIGVVGANPAVALSDSDSPPQNPSSRFSRAYALHGSTEGQASQIFRALASRLTLASGRSAKGAKKSELSPRQLPWSTQLIVGYSSGIFTEISNNLIFSPTQPNIFGLTPRATVRKRLARVKRFLIILREDTYLKNR